LSHSTSYVSIHPSFSFFFLSFSKDLFLVKWDEIGRNGGRGGRNTSCSPCKKWE
jgi:hypothetical protein